MELEVGDVAVAKNYFEGFDDSWSFWDTYYRAHAYRRLGEIAEREGRADDTIEWYGRLLAAWRECAPELVPLREEVAARREVLASQRSGGVGE